MKPEIDAIFLDIGNTLRILVKEEPWRMAARQRIVEMVDTDADPRVFSEELDRRYKVYRKWAFENLTEASEQELWTRWLAPEFPRENIERQAHELTYQFRQAMGRRVMADGCKEVVAELHRRGYVMGIISNVITTQEIPDWLKAEDLEKYFTSVVLSSLLGLRKPHPGIYLEASRRAGVEPEKCAYVGDNFSRDVIGTRAAGFGMVVIMPDPADENEPIAEEHQPDLIIQKLGDLLKHFPGPGLN